MRSVTQQIDSRGVVCVQYRRRGDRVIGPYYARFWREHGKLRKAYVRLADVEATRAACDERRIRERKLRESRDHLKRLVSDITLVAKIAFLPERYDTDEKILSQLSPRQIARLDHILATQCQ